MTMSKKLGQNFLVNKDKIKKIIEVLEIRNGETIIEIGAGHGELTKELRIRNQKLGAENDRKIKYGIKVIAIEKDEKLARDLRNKIDDLGLKNVKVIEGDALKILPKLTNNLQLTTFNYKLVGNIPYYITGYLLRVISGLENKPKLTIFTIQKEVAERIIAKSPDMNLLAAATQFWAEAGIIDYIPKEDFRPKPKVDSAIIKLRIRNYESGIGDNYYKFIKILFKQPRKTIVNNLTSDKTQEIGDKKKIIDKLKKMGIEPNARAQDLSVEKIIEMSKLMMGK